jgi:hypothetical protein
MAVAMVAAVAAQVGTKVVVVRGGEEAPAVAARVALMVEVEQAAAETGVEASEMGGAGGTALERQAVAVEVVE